ncbi:hypothetical protein [Rathayibacter rathayi]|nr:hypothetical protein [Rathayibacter rathayi]
MAFTSVLHGGHCDRNGAAVARGPVTAPVVALFTAVLPALA